MGAKRRAELKRITAKHIVDNNEFVAEPISESTPQMNFSLMRASAATGR